MERTILHSDCNSFYASVECLYRPEIRDKPVAVAGDVEQRHGIILTKNQIAKRFGVATGEAIWQAKQKCPELVTVPAHYDLYMQFSEAARAIYARYTERIEPFGLDECWLDLTGNTGLFGGGPEIAQEIRRTVKRELGITVSVGVSWNKIFAKLGSDMKKPDAVTVITKEDFKQKVWPLPASDLLYVGPATTRKLTKYGIHTIGVLAGMPIDWLSGRFGKWGGYLWAFANGKDTSPVAPMGYASPIKSVGNSMTTWRDVETPEEAWQVFLALSESVARRLRENGFRCRTVQISVRDKDLFWCEFQAQLQTPCCTARELAAAAFQLFRRQYRFVKPLRSLGVRGCDLIDAATGLQISLFDSAKREKWEQLERCVDGLRGRFGRDAVKRAALIGADITGESDSLTHDVHPIGFFGR